MENSQTGSTRLVEVRMTLQHAPLFIIERDQIVTGPKRQRAAELQLMLGLDHFVRDLRVSRPLRGLSAGALLPEAGVQASTADSDRQRQ
jgi:hypothetical protein